ncbi:MAG: hypothetical protein QNJ75_11565 [Acidimicrobiia bacterium]|nr:hypothetical protein [Acidimicrobiia bacterium]
MQDLTFVVGEDRAVADLWEALGEAGIQMEASCTFPRLEGRIVHVVVKEDDADTAYDALREQGFIPLDRRKIIIANITPRPGELGRIARAIADRGAKLYILYMATGDRVVVGASDLDKAAEALDVVSG